MQVIAEGYEVSLAGSEHVLKLIVVMVGCTSLKNH